MSKAAKIWATGIKRSTTVMEAQSPLTSARIEATIPPIQPQRATFQTPIADARNSTPPIRPIAPMMDRRRTFEPGSLGYKPSDGISEAPANADRIPKTIDTIDATLTSTGLAKRTRPHSEMTSWTKYFAQPQDTRRGRTRTLPDTCAEEHDAIYSPRARTRTTVVT